jgi:hypothetical protein
MHQRAAMAGVREAPRHGIAGKETCCGKLYAKLEACMLKIETR